MFFWAKTTTDGHPGISVVQHMIDVGHVAQALAERSLKLLESMALKPEQISTLAALHDLGKISPGFQQKCVKWLEQYGLNEIAKNNRWDAIMEGDHGKVTHASLQQFLKMQGVEFALAARLASAIGGHHGKIEPPNEFGYKTRKLSTESRTTISWEKERLAAAEKLREHFSADFATLSLSSDSSVIWWLAGLTSVADWIGSDVRNFPNTAIDRDTDTHAIAQRAVVEAGLAPIQIRKGMSFHDLFGDQQQLNLVFRANDMQVQAMQFIREPGVYIIEAPMGMGKTEAALSVAYNLMCQDKARGIYFALPTQATSNRIHQRLDDFVKRISLNPTRSRLIHGSSWLLDQVPVIEAEATGPDNEPDAREGKDWFCSAKRALIAPFGVGTIDQALLGVLAAKHFFVRRFALAEKVVILDEVHTYDLYTGTLIDRLIEVLKEMRCTIIVLSATLTGKRRRQIVELDSPAIEARNSYPLICGQSTDGTTIQMKADPPSEKKISLQFVSQAAAVNEVLLAVAQGACVVWICNSVAKAQSVYSTICGRLSDQTVSVGLLHSRFPYWRREQLEDFWMEQLGKSSQLRRPCVLVSTQIVEQSVDIDADLLISDLAPSDMLLQRVGRLWRHERPRPNAMVPRMVILEEAVPLTEFQKINANEVIEQFGEKALIYDPYVLLRTLSVWSELDSITLPNQTRALIEATYSSVDSEPESWQELYDKMLGRTYALRQQALQNSNIWTVQLSDTEGVQTRISDVPTISLLLCIEFTSGRIELLDRSIIHHSGTSFDLKVAQALHKNIIKVPAHYFTIAGTASTISRYISGGVAFGLLQPSGTVHCSCLHANTRLNWSLELGLEIVRATGDSGEK